MAESIKVAVRVRPFTEKEIAEDSELVVSMNGRETTLNTLPHKTFTFDFSYWSFSSEDAHFVDQDTIMLDIGNEILQSALDGYNGCLFAYGQTGSGKTYSVTGSDKSPGIIPRTVDGLFDAKKGLEADPLKEVRIWVSYLEIYNEHLRDLLKLEDDAEDPKRKELQVVEHPKFGVHVPGQMEEPCKSTAEVSARLTFGAKKRAVGETRMNSQSSRSHTVFCIRLEILTGPHPPPGAPKDTRQVLTAKINLIDLAGSERLAKTQAEGIRMREGCAINKSLSSLGMIIKELSEARQDALNILPFRTSKLTFLLKDSLAGNSKTYMMAAISPSSTNIAETMSTLRFAASVKTIKTTAKQNRHSRAGMISELKQELEDIKAQLAEARASSADVNTNIKMLAKVEDIEEQERLLEAIMPNYAEQVKMAKEMDTKRVEAMEDGALSREEITNMFGVIAETPYLLNLADDPLLAGNIIYYIGEGAKVTIGSSPDSVVQLRGIGVSQDLCVIENRPGSKIYVKKCNEDGRLIVDGRPMEPGQFFKLKHGQSLFFGRAHAFKLCKPGFEHEGRSSDIKEMMDGVEDERGIMEHSPTFTDVANSIQRALQQVNQNYGKELLERAHLACRACDEANDITAECRPDLDMRFQVTITDANIFPPDVVVRTVVESADSILRPSMGATFSMKEYKQHSCMTVAEMLERLDRMQEICNHQLAGMNAMPADWLHDPWEPHSLADLEHLVMTLEMRTEGEGNIRRQMELENRSLKAEIQQLKEGVSSPILRSDAKNNGASSSDAAKTLDDLCKDLQADNMSSENQKLVEALHYAKQIMADGSFPVGESSSPSNSAMYQPSAPSSSTLLPVSPTRVENALVSPQVLSPRWASPPRCASPVQYVMVDGKKRAICPSPSRHSSPTRYASPPRYARTNQQGMKPVPTTSGSMVPAALPVLTSTASLPRSPVSQNSSTALRYTMTRSI